MMIKHTKAFLVGLMVILFINSFFNTALISHAQSSEVWSEPINLSAAGSSTNPELVIDSNGVIHAIWLDEIDGYKYTKSTDKVSWTAPKTVRLPFSIQSEAQPVFLPGQDGEIHVLWQDNTLTLYYSKILSALDDPSSWGSVRKLATGVLDFSAVISAGGVLHVSYLSSLVTETDPSGVYYLQYKQTVWSKPVNLYSSPYFRSLTPEETNIRLAVSEEDSVETVYLVWDDRPRRQILMTRSLDGGLVWENNTPVRSPENSSGLEMFYNINIGVAGRKVLLLWQSGLPGAQCTQYSQWSVDGGQRFSPPERVLSESDVCPQVTEIAMMDEDYAVVWLNVFDDISLVAWNGARWSEYQKQADVTTFVNPNTLDTVLFTSQQLSFYNDQLFVVGGDKGTGRDIWFLSRSLGTADDWFPSTSEWTAPVEVMGSPQELSVLSSAADNKNNIHTFWVQPPVLNPTAGKSTVQYSRWNGESWSIPVSILFGLPADLRQLSVKADNQNRLLLTWVDSNSGDLFMSWANADAANKPSEWKKPQYIPSASQTNSSPDLLLDDAGKVVVAYAIPVNEHRGIYFAESTDGGVTWLRVFQVFDAVAAGWEIVDHPAISLTADGRLHVLFSQYTWRSTQRVSLGLYYSQSADGGVTWSVPSIVSDHPVLWSEIYSYDQSTVHRVWQEADTSTLFSFHQVSQDSGATWSDPVIISSIEDRPADLTAQAMDSAGNIHFLQLAGKSQIMIESRMWNGSRWISQASKDLSLSNRGIPSSITASVSSKGNLVVSVLVDYPEATDGLMANVLSVGKSIKLPQGGQTPQPAILVEAAEPTAVVTAESPEIGEPAANDVSVQDIKEPQSLLSENRNLVGLFLVGGILLSILVVFWPLSKKHADQKKISE